ncbi:MAG: HlyD family efflux transporter periplasmic adaptor subunit, partial [Burkholderiales bacterium]|nr:HlyD family efflux transporter periplasmic adaptor subunit [Burkholderiales bacterium]
QTRQLVGVKALADDGYAPKNQALQMAQAETELRSSLTDIEANIQRSESAIAEARLRIAQRKQEYMKEASTQLADVRREVQANQERLAAISTDLSRMQIRAPVAGQVVGLTLGGPGGVVSPGQRLMDILPRGESLLLDAKIAPAVIDRVRVGDTVEVRFSAFANTPQLVAQGKLISLSGDAVSEGNSSPPFYLARVALTDSGRKELGDRVMQPGMNAEVLIKTGERSLLTYLMHPLIKRVKSSMIEE